MTTKSKLAIATLLISAFASPVFAAQLGVGADPGTDARYMQQTTYRPAPPAAIFNGTSGWMHHDAANERLAGGQQ
jgi:hypothetical protein